MRVEKPVFSDEGFEKNLILYDCERDGLVSSVDFCVFPERRYLLSGWGGYQAVSCHCLDLAGFVHCGT